MIDARAAAEFASRFGYPNVMYFNGRDVAPELPTREAAEAFINANADQDLYFCPAHLRDVFVGKPKKTDVLGSTWAWADIDPPKGTADLAAWQEATLAEVAATDLPRATICVFSGRGLWFYWRLGYRAEVATVEAINFALAQRLGGDSCWSIDHACRLPFTRNSKTGLVGKVLWDDGPSHDPSCLPQAEPARTRSADVSFDAVAEVDLRKVIFDLSVDDDRKNRIYLAATDPAFIIELDGKGTDPNDRSGVMFSWAIMAVMADMPPSRVRDCLLTPGLPISAHLLDPKKVRPGSRDRAAERQVERAYAFARDRGWEPRGEAEERAREDAEGVGLISLAPVPSDLPARPWLVEGMLMDGQVCMLTGRGGEGKSLLALQIGIMIATGGEFGWWSSRQRRNVLLLNAEDNLDEQRRRLLGGCDVMGVDPRRLEDRLFTLNTERLVLVQRDPEDNKIKTTALYDRIALAIRDHEIGLLVIDPLVEAHVNLDENSNVDMKELVLALRALARQRSIPILIVHHSRKGAAGGDQDGARGGSALVNACRTVVTVERMDKEAYDSIRPPHPKERYARVNGAKSNYAARIDDRWLEIIPIDLPNGDQVPGFQRIVFGQVDDGFDADTWSHREVFLALVQRGNGRRPWSVAKTGPTSARLDAAVAEQFKLDARQAGEVIARYAKAKLISVENWKGDDRKSSAVWVVPGQELPAGTIEMPF